MLAIKAAAAAIYAAIRKGKSAFIHNGGKSPIALICNPILNCSP